MNYQSLFWGEKDELVGFDRIRADYEEGLQRGDFADEPRTLAEYLQDVTGSGGYWQRCHGILKTLPEFLAMAELNSIDDLVDTEMRLLEHDLPGIKYAIGNSDNVEIILIKE